jgi:hypothetical protein
MTEQDNIIREKILLDLELTHKRLIQTKKERNWDLIISDNGKIIKVKAKDL